MAAVKTGLSRKLLTRVLSVYFALTLIVTVGQIFTEYLSTKNHVEEELQTLKNTFSSSLTRAMWEINDDQVRAIAEGLMSIPIVEGLQVRGENGNFITEQGIRKSRSPNPVEREVIEDHSGGVFSYSFPLVFKFAGRESTVGDVTLYSSFDTIFSRIEVGVFFLIGNAIVKTTFLVFLFMTAFRTMLSEPLQNITEQMGRFDPERPEESKLTLEVKDDNELLQLRDSYNSVIDDLIASNHKLKSAQDELTAANTKLDDQNLVLEQEVAKKTASLSQIMLDLEQQKDELISHQRELRQENKNRQYIESELRKKNDELAGSMQTLNQAQKQLVESERMASLGGLVAGITHDINTPLGVSVTAASFLQERLINLKQDFEDTSLTSKSMASFIDEADQTAKLLLNNLGRASDLIASFKQVAVDQTSENERDFDLGEYIAEVLQSLQSGYKQTKHNITVNCPPELIVTCAPGAIAQIVSNLTINSLNHAFEDKAVGNINLNVEAVDDQVVMHFEDDGKGLAKDELSQLFDAFFTTKRGSGGSGLGTHIVYNLVTQSLNGKIDAQSELGKGLRYTITFPISQH
ncbi:HAMP domain-containing sensor histidine kinase [Alteromonas sp. P256]|uniref:HAMP domain-containing sensor histidine kinase n=1 Tax=Alteromonas sp. P256 TaxID=3117399 RepID=UPI002FE05332